MWNAGWVKHKLEASLLEVISIPSYTPKSLQILIAAMKLKDTCSLEETYDQPRQYIKKQRHYFIDKGPSNQDYGFSSSRI